jgi:hypothetical protein
VVKVLSDRMFDRSRLVEFYAVHRVLLWGVFPPYLAIVVSLLISPDWQSKLGKGSEHSCSSYNGFDTLNYFENLTSMAANFLIFTFKH